MAIKPIGSKDECKTTILRVTILKQLMDDIRETKKLCKKHGFVFDIKPDIENAVRTAIQEARSAINNQTGHRIK